jgi:hypothetical protein
MSLAHSPRIVTDGLVLCLDVGNQRSYPGSGTVWRDLSGKNNNATIFNTPTYSDGALVFDAVDDYAYVSPSSTTTFDASTSYTISLWFKLNSSSRGGLDTLFEGNGGARIWFYLTSGNTLIFNTYYGPFVEGVGHLNDYYQTIGEIPDTNKWYNALVFHDKTNLKQGTYLDGVLQDEYDLLSGYTFVSNSGGGFFINNGTFGPAGCKFGNIQVYNRVLTPQEIQQNFNALKGRFNLT